MERSTLHARVILSRLAPKVIVLFSFACEVDCAEFGFRLGTWFIPCTRPFLTVCLLHILLDSTSCRCNVLRGRRESSLKFLFRLEFKPRSSVATFSGPTSALLQPLLESKPPPSRLLEVPKAPFSEVCQIFTPAIYSLYLQVMHGRFPPLHPSLHLPLIAGDVIDVMYEGIKCPVTFLDPNLPTQYLVLPPLPNMVTLTQPHDPSVSQLEDRVSTRDFNRPIGLLLFTHWT